MRRMVLRYSAAVAEIVLRKREEEERLALPRRLVEIRLQPSRALRGRLRK